MKSEVYYTLGYDVDKLFWLRLVFPEGRPGMSNVSPPPFPLPRVESQLSFDSTLLSSLLFSCFLPLFFLSCLFFLLVRPPGLFPQKILQHFSLGVGFIL